MTCLAIIWAGGQGRRMGGMDKAFVFYQALPLIDHVVRRLDPQVDEIVINSSRIKSHAGKRILADRIGTGRDDVFLALETSLWFFVHETDFKELIHVPTDTPLIPEDLVTKLRSGASRPAFVQSPSGAQPTVALWDRASARYALQTLTGYDGTLKGLMAAAGGEPVAFPSDQPFCNLNRPEDLSR